MKKLIVVLFGLFSAGAFAQNTGTLTFSIKGIESNEGQILVQLFRPTDKVPTRPFLQICGQITDQTCTINVPNIDFGDYAAIIVHDQNRNNHIDHRLGIPAEPLGYTNHWKLGLWSGMPTFEKLKFSFSKTQLNQTILIN